MHAVSLTAEPLDFNRDIRPILADNCIQCHGPDAAKREANLRLDVEENAKKPAQPRPAIAPGSPEESELIRRIYHTDPDDLMPPPESNKQLSKQEKETLKQWILQGAEWDTHWAFTPPTRPEIPITQDLEWPRNEIDSFVLKRLEQEGIAPSSEATRATLIRRLSLDLTGLPPSLRDVDAFLSDARPDAYERAVDRLLQSPEYGEHMAWQWLDAARYADTDGYQNDGPREMWRWRDWVIQAYNTNLPFDQFTIEQLAGDLLPHPTLDQVIATGFNRNHRYNSESGLVFEEFLLENAVDRVDTTSTVWMGLTMGCARCHDHKYDPISQEEYYQLIAYFNNVPESGRAIKFGNSEPWIKAPTRAQQRELRSLENEVKKAKTNLAAATHRIKSAQERWEESNPSSKDFSSLLSEGLNFQYAIEKPLTATRSAGHKLEKIPHLICNGRFSLAFQLLPETVESGAVLSSENKGTGRNGILVEFKDGHLRFHIISRWIAGVATLETADSVPPNKPVHVTLTNDGSQRAKGMQIYLNGKPAATRTLHNSNSNKSPEQFGDVLQFGASPHVPSWQGQIRDLRIYNYRTLSAHEANILSVEQTIPQILNLNPDERSELQQAKLQAYFLEHEAPIALKKLRENLFKAEARLVEFEDSLPTTMVMEERNPPKETHIRKRGVYHQKGPAVQRGVPKTLSRMPDHYPKNRLGFARWLVNGEHPLTARVVVNRYWQQIFGRGLVDTPEDFGIQGSLPSHPELLDWLAVEFVEQGWDTHHILKKIVCSATYRQSSQIRPDILDRDPRNTLLTHAPRKRLPGNILRDQALAASGLLVRHEGGPSVKPYQPKKLWSEASNFTYKIGTGSDLYRRSLYTYWKRTLAPPSMALLDTADREWCSVRPKRTNTPLQALTLLNEKAFFEAAAALGKKIYLHPGSTKEKLRLAFRTVTSRSPSEPELSLLEESLAGYQTELRSSPEAIEQLLSHFPHAELRDAAREEQAAWIALANVLLNLDESTTRE